MEAAVGAEGARALADALRAHGAIAPDVLVQLRPAPSGGGGELWLASVSPGATASLVSAVAVGLAGASAPGPSRTASVSADALAGALRGLSSPALAPMARGVPYVLVRGALPGVARVAKVAARDAPFVHAAAPPLDAYAAAAEVWPDALADALARLGGARRAPRDDVRLSLAPAALRVARQASRGVCARALLAAADVAAWLGTGRDAQHAAVGRAPLAAAARLAAARGVPLRLGVPAAASGAPVLADFGSDAAGVRSRLCLVAGAVDDAPGGADEVPPSDSEYGADPEGGSVPSPFY